LCDRRPHDLTHARFLGGGHHLVLDDAPQHRILGLRGDQLEAKFLGQGGAREDLVGGPLADADVVRLALTNHVGKSLHRFLKGSLGVEAVRLIDVHVVGLESGQGAVDGFHDVLAAQARVVRTAWPRGPVDLGEDLEAFTAFTFENVAEDGFGLGVRVGVGRVERGDADVKCGLDARGSGFVLDLRTVREPVAEGEFGDLESGIAQIAIVDHAPTLTPLSAPVVTFRKRDAFSIGWLCWTTRPGTRRGARLAWARAVGAGS